MLNVEIISYEDKYKSIIKELNHEWLKKYDLWEPLDDEYLDHPKEKVLDKGGFILLAKCENDIIGTIFMVPAGESVCEFCKLCVDEKYRRLGIGKSLMKKSLEMSKEAGFNAVILYSSSRLQSALSMYKKLGFKQIVDEDGKYELSDIKLIRKTCEMLY